MMGFHVGSTFGDYTVVRLLGKGGMGEVWLLKNAAGVEVAAKILDSATSKDHESRKRFLREAQLALGVRHPNLVEVYDIGEDPETGLCYILMEYVSGGTLADRIRTQGALPIREAVAIVREIAGVLELAREKGIVHRDIKPANIMFAADGTPKLADLGIARGGSGVETTTVTQTGTMIGTPAYMSPEQMLDAHNVDTRADIYSLGIVFYEMLTGERPNKDDTVVQLMAKAIKGEPLPDVRKLRPEVSASVAELLNLMTAKDLGRRISSPKRIVEIAIEIESGVVSLKLEAPKSIAIKKERPASASPIPSATEPRRGLLPWILLGMVALAFAVIGFLLRPQQSAPSAVQTPELSPVPVIGCDVSSHGNAELYLSLRRPEIVRQFDEGARAFPLLFKLDERILRKINVLVLHSYSGNAFYDADECRQIENFVKGGGVVVALATCSSSAWGGSGGPVAKWLQSLGASLYNAPNEHHLRAVAMGRTDAWGRFSDTNATNYAICTTDWEPLVVADADPSKIVSGVRRVGKGAVVFAPADYLFRKFASGRSAQIEYPWAEVVPPRIAFEPRPDSTFSGSVLSDAPASDTSGRIHLYSSDLSQSELRYLAKLQSDADREIARRFGQEVLTLSRMSNCVVRSQFRPSWYLSGEWMPSRSCFEVSTGTPFPSRPGSMPVFEVCSFIRCSLLPRAERTFQGSPVLDYMASAVVEALATNGYERAFRKNAYPDVRGESLTGAIAAARRIDPDFSHYDCFGKPRSASARKLNGRESFELRCGRFFAMMQDIREKHPDICRRYLLVLAEGRRGTSERETFDILCELCGNDWPKRWPEPEPAATSVSSVSPPTDASSASPRHADGKKRGTVRETGDGEGVVIGCDISPHGGVYFYEAVLSPLYDKIFGSKARILPFQFLITPELLSKINLLAMSQGCFFGMDEREQSAVDRFLRQGGVVLCLIHSDTSAACESRAPACRWLQKYGATVYNSGGGASGNAVLAEAFRKNGAEFSCPYRSVYALCDKRWTPILVLDNEPTKCVGGFSRIGKGSIVFVPEGIVCAVSSRRNWQGEFPWWDVVLSRLSSPKAPDSSFTGSQLSDAPYKAKTSRLSFYSSVVNEAELCRLAEFTISADSAYKRLWGEGIFGFCSRTNCIVGHVDNAKPLTFAQRLSDLGAFEFEAFNRTLDGRINEWVVCKYLRDLVFSPKSSSEDRMAIQRIRNCPAVSYMAAAVWDEIWERDAGRRFGSFIRTGEFGLKAIVRKARALDPDFLKYDANGNPRTVETPKLDWRQREDYQNGRRCAMMEDFAKERPDVVRRLLKITAERCSRRYSGSDDQMSILCEAYGSDRPRRWPGK